MEITRDKFDQALELVLDAASRAEKRGVTLQVTVRFGDLKGIDAMVFVGDQLKWLLAASPGIGNFDESVSKILKMLQNEGRT